MPMHKNNHEFKYYANQTLQARATQRDKFLALYAEAKLGREELLAVAAEVAGRFNGTKKVPSLKNSDVAWEKTIRGKPANSQPSNSDIAKLNDLARGSVYFPRLADLNNAKEFINQKYNCIIFDRFEDGAEDSGYRDVKYLLKLKIDSKGGSEYHVCELQLHTTFTRDSYGKIHPIYEIIRRAGKKGEQSTVTVPADEVPKLAKQLWETYRTVRIRHMGGIQVTNAFYAVIVKFHTDDKLSKAKNVPVTLDSDDLEALQKMMPVINDAYFKQMQHAWVMIDGKLQQSVNRDAQNTIDSGVNQKGPKGNTPPQVVNI